MALPRQCRCSAQPTAEHHTQPSTVHAISRNQHSEEPHSGVLTLMSGMAMGAAGSEGLSLRNPLPDTRLLMESYGVPQGPLSSHSRPDMWRDIAPSPARGRAPAVWSGAQVPVAQATGALLAADYELDEESERDLAQVQPRGGIVAQRPKLRLPQWSGRLLHGSAALALQATLVS